MSAISFTTETIFKEASLSTLMVELLFSANSFACVAEVAALVTWLLISLIAADSSSVALATLVTS